MTLFKTLTSIVLLLNIVLGQGLQFGDQQGFGTDYEIIAKEIPLESDVDLDDELKYVLSDSKISIKATYYKLRLTQNGSLLLLASNELCPPPPEFF